MSSSSSGKVTQTVTKGFAARDVSNFLKSGGQLASQGARKKKITDFKPDEKTRIRDVTESRDFLGIKTTGGSDITSGFLGQFSNISAEELDKITDTFIQRQKQVRSRRAQGGRSDVFLGGQ